jgi:hypothetical protein
MRNAMGLDPAVQGLLMDLEEVRRLGDGEEFFGFGHDALPAPGGLSRGLGNPRFL